MNQSAFDAMEHLLGVWVDLFSYILIRFRMMRMACHTRLINSLHEDSGEELYSANSIHIIQYYHLLDMKRQA